MRDKLGREILIGSFIVYAISVGDSPALRVGKVLGFKEKTITVRGVRDRYSWDSTSQHSLCEANGHLSHPGRIIVIEESAVPEDYRNLLEVIE